MKKLTLSLLFSTTYILNNDSSEHKNTPHKSLSDIPFNCGSLTAATSLDEFVLLGNPTGIISVSAKKIILPTGNQSNILMIDSGGNVATSDSATSIACGPLSAGDTNCGNLNADSLTVNNDTTAYGNLDITGDTTCTNLTAIGSIKLGSSYGGINIDASALTFPDPGLYSLLMIDYQGGLTTPTGNFPFSCGDLTTTSIKTSGTLTAGATTVNSLTSIGILNCGILKAAQNPNQAILLGNASGAISVFAQKIIAPINSSYNNVLTIDYKNNLATADNTTSVTFGNFTAAGDPGQTVTLGNNSGAMKLLFNNIGAGGFLEVQSDGTLGIGTPSGGGTSCTSCTNFTATGDINLGTTLANSSIKLFGNKLSSSGVLSIDGYTGELSSEPSAAITCSSLIATGNIGSATGSVSGASLQTNGSLKAATSKGNLIQLGMINGNVLNFTSDSGDILLNANNPGSNLDLEANNNIFLTASNINIASDSIIPPDSGSGLTVPLFIDENNNITTDTTNFNINCNTLTTTGSLNGATINGNVTLGNINGIIKLLFNDIGSGGFLEVQSDGTLGIGTPSGGGTSCTSCTNFTATGDISLGTTLANSSIKLFGNKLSSSGLLSIDGYTGELSSEPSAAITCSSLIATGNIEAIGSLNGASIQTNGDLKAAISNGSLIQLGMTNGANNLLSFVNDSGNVTLQAQANNPTAANLYLSSIGNTSLLSNKKMNITGNEIDIVNPSGALGITLNSLTGPITLSTQNLILGNTTTAGSIKLIFNNIGSGGLLQVDQIGNLSIWSNKNFECGNFTAANNNPGDTINLGGETINGNSGNYIEFRNNDSINGITIAATVANAPLNLTASGYVILKGAQIDKPSTSGNTNGLFIDSNGYLTTTPGISGSPCTCSSLTASSVNATIGTFGNLAAAQTSGETVNLAQGAGSIINLGISNGNQINFTNNTSNLNISAGAGDLNLNSTGDINIEGNPNNGSSINIATNANTYLIIGESNKIGMVSNIGTINITSNAQNNSGINFSTTGHIVLKGNEITYPLTGTKSILKINNSGQIICDGSASLNLESLIAAADKGLTVSLGIDDQSSNYFNFTSDASDITLQAHATNANLNLSAVGNIILTSSGIIVPSNGNNNLLMIDSTGNVKTANNTTQITLNSVTATYLTGNVVNTGPLTTSNITNSGDLSSTGNTTLGNLTAAGSSNQIVTIGMTSGSNNIIWPSSGTTPIYINHLGQLTTTTSSRAYKEDIAPLSIDNNSFDLLEPVSFHYRKDDQRHLEYGFIAENLVNIPILQNTIIYGHDGAPLSINYQAVFVAMTADYLITKKAIKLELQAKNKLLVQFAERCALLENQLYENDLIINELQIQYKLQNKIINELQAKYTLLEEIIAKITGRVTSR